MLGVIGDLVQDVVVHLHEPLRHASDTRSSVHVTRGGSAANVAACAAPYHPTRFIGSVGDDVPGQGLRAELTDRGVDVRLQVSDALPTGTIVVLVEPGGERSMLPGRGACADLGPVDPTWLDGVDLLHLTTYSLDGGRTASSVMDAARHVRRSGGRVSLDASSAGVLQHLGVEHALDLIEELQVDVLSANEDECRLLGLADWPDEAEGAAPGRAHERLSGITLLARRGRRPTTVLSAGRDPLVVPVPPVQDVRDLTGAGDGFNAGYLAALLNGSDPEAACRAGHALAAKVITGTGATVTG